MTKNYCSRDCQAKDWEDKHQEFCSKSADKRKIKGGAEERAKSEMENMEENIEWNKLKAAAVLSEETLAEVHKACQKKGSKVVKNSKAKSHTDGANQ